MRDLTRLEEDLAGAVSSALHGRDVAATAPELRPRPVADEPVLAAWWALATDDPHVLRLPNPWNDPEALRTMEAACDALAVDLLDQLATFLGQIHGVRHDARYWEALLGPLLTMTITEVADRRLFLRSAIAAAPDAPLIAGGGELRPATSVWEAVNLQLGEEWNLALVERLARATSIGLRPRVEPVHLPSRASGADAPLGVRVASRGLALARGLPVRVMRSRARRPIGGERRLALLGHVNLSANQLRALRRAIPGLAVGAASEPYGADHPDPTPHPARARLAGLKTESELGDSVVALLPDLLPRTALEDYARLVDESRRVHGAPCHVVHGNWAWGDLDGEFLGRCRSGGFRLAFAQHGGATYQLALAPHERGERRLATMQLAWGRTEGPERAVRSPHVARLTGKHRGGSRVVVVEGLSPPLTWPFRFTSTPLGDQWLDDEARLVRFVEAAGAVRDRFVLRRYPGIGFEGVRHASLEALPVASRVRRQTATAWMRHARVAVLAYPDTPFLEAMAIGVPVIGTWNPRWWGQREDARRHFDALRAVGVIHDEPESAAAQLEAVYDDPAVWWESSEVKAVRAAFCERFALGGDWLTDWRDALADLTRPA